MDKTKEGPLPARPKPTVEKQAKPEIDRSAEPRFIRGTVDPPVRK